MGAPTSPVTPRNSKGGSPKDPKRAGDSLLEPENMDRWKKQKAKRLIRLGQVRRTNHCLDPHFSTADRSVFAENGVLAPPSGHAKPRAGSFTDIDAHQPFWSMSQSKFTWTTSTSHRRHWMDISDFNSHQLGGLPPTPFFHTVSSIPAVDLVGRSRDRSEAGTS